MNVQQTVAQYGDLLTGNPKAQVVLGTALASTPLWLTTIQTWATAGAAICGFIIGLHGVYKIVRNAFKK